MKFLSTLTVLLLIPFAADADTTILLPDEEKFANNERNIFVKTTIPGSFKSPGDLLKTMFSHAGQAKNSDLTNPFEIQILSGSSHFGGARDLQHYYRGARKKGRTITISFSGDAMRYLNNTISIQQFVKGTIHATLRHHYPLLKTISYEIDGEIVTDWDA